jgi:tetratricopeptide (TPR) repeat protein
MRRGVFGILIAALVVTSGGGCSKEEEVTKAADRPSGDPAPSASAAPRPSLDEAQAKEPAGIAAIEAERGGEKLREEDERRFLKVMGEARALHEKKDYEGAIKGFQGALAIAPDDPLALSGLGWAAFYAKDLDLAEASTKKALERATEAYLKALCHYNMGRIQEERGRREDAIASYKRSLELKMNPVVKERLAKLDAALAAAFEALGITGTKGPFVSLEAFCDDWKKRALPEKVRCDPKAEGLGEAYKGPLSVAKPGAPYQAVRVVASSRAVKGGDPPELGGGATEYHLVLRTKVGFFALEKAAETSNPGEDGITESLTVKELAVLDAIPGGAAEVLFRVSHYRGDSNMAVNELEEYVKETLTVCGVGPSEKPSCTRPIPLLWSEHVGVISPDIDEPGMKHNLRDKKGSLSAAFLPDGMLELKPGAGELLEAFSGLPGKHALKFP